MVAGVDVDVVGAVVEFVDSDDDDDDDDEELVGLAASGLGASPALVGCCALLDGTLLGPEVSVPDAVAVEPVVDPLV